MLLKRKPRIIVISETFFMEQPAFSIVNCFYEVFIEHFKFCYNFVLIVHTPNLR